MNGVTKEQIAAAKRMTAIEFLRRYRPNDLVKSSARGEFELRSHDSFKINGESSVWHWKSRGIGGKSALDYLIYVEGVRFVDAVRLLCEESPAYTEPAHESIERERPPFALPAAAPNNDRIVQYLLGRGVSIPVISYCMEQGILYESTPYHNCVLVGKDENGQPKYAALRGTYQYGRPFKAEASGSDKRYGFCIPPTAESDTVAVFEAAIDAMAEMTLAGSAADKYRLSLGGIYVPEQTHTIKPPAALEEFLRRHPHVVRMELCLDNDPPGRMATAALAEHYGKRYAVAVRLPQLDGADYGDLAQMAMRQKAIRREQAEIARREKQKCRKKVNKIHTPKWRCSATMATSLPSLAEPRGCCAKTDSATSPEKCVSGCTAATAMMTRSLSSPSMWKPNCPILTIWLHGERRPNRKNEVMHDDHRQPKVRNYKPGPPALSLAAPHPCAERCARGSESRDAGRLCSKCG